MVDRRTSSEPAQPSSLGGRLCELRERRGWTQRKLAEEARLSPSFISEIENDKRNVSSEVLLRLADVLGTSLDYLVRGEDVRLEREPLVLPSELADAAEECGWTVGHAADLLKTRQIVVARRHKTAGRPRPLREWLKEDWITLNNKLFPDDEA